MAMQYRIGHSGLETATTFSEKEAMNLRDRVQPYFSKPLEIIPVLEKPQLQVIEGGKK